MHHGGAISFSVSYTLTPTYPHLSSAAIPYNRWVLQTYSRIQKLDYGANMSLEAASFPHFNQFFIDYFRSLFFFISFVWLLYAKLSEKFRRETEEVCQYLASIEIHIPINSQPATNAASCLANTGAPSFILSKTKHQNKMSE